MPGRGTEAVSAEPAAGDAPAAVAQAGAAAGPRAAGDAPAAVVPAGVAAGPVGAGAGPADAGPVIVPLRRNGPYQLLWTGSAASSLGIAVADVAYPLAILAVTGSPARAGLFAAVQVAGQLLAGVPAGHLADREDQRRILIVSEAGRALITAGLAVALVLGAFTLPLLLTAAALLGAGQAVSSAARLVLIRAAVPPEQLTRALTQDEVRINGASLAGPPVAGALYGLRALAHATPFLFTAGSFLVSLLCALLLKKAPVKAGPGRAGSSPPQAPTGNGQRSEMSGQRSGMFSGVTALLGDPVLRAVVLLITAVNTVGVGLDLIAVVILRQQSVSSAMIGIALAGGAVGGLAGAPLVRPLHRIRPGVLLLAVCAVQAPLFALLAVGYGPWWIAGLLFAAMLGVPALRVLLDVLILRPFPEGERGRVAGAVMTLLGLGMPAGYAAAGLLLQFFAARTAMLILAAALAVGVLGAAAQRELWRARWPK
jgi:MFS family permease